MLTLAFQPNGIATFAPTPLVNMAFSLLTVVLKSIRLMMVLLTLAFQPKNGATIFSLRSLVCVAFSLLTVDLKLFYLMTIVLP